MQLAKSRMKPLIYCSRWLCDKWKWLTLVWLILFTKIVFLYFIFFILFFLDLNRSLIIIGSFAILFTLKEKKNHHKVFIYNLHLGLPYISCRLVKIKTRLNVYPRLPLRGLNLFVAISVHWKKKFKVFY